MTTNIRLLSKRKLLPFNKTNSTINQLPYNIKFITKNAFLDSVHYNDFSPELITQYLDNNPIFLETYLMNSAKFRASYKVTSVADSLIMEPIVDKSASWNAYSEGKTSGTDTKSDINIFSEKPSLYSSSNYRLFNDRELFIQKLISYFDESFPRASILKVLYDSLSSGLEADEVKMYLLDSKNASLYLYDPIQMNSEIEAKEVYAFNSAHSLAAGASFYKYSILYPNMRMHLYPQLSKYKSEYVIMAQPLTDYTGSVYGAVELIKTKQKILFNKADEEVVTNYITWSSIALFFTDILQKNSQQQQSNNYIMKVTQTMFANFKHMDNVIMDIMKYAKHIVKGARSAFFVVEKDTKEIVAEIFDVGNENDVKFKTEKNNIRFPIGIGIAGQVAATGETLNIRDAYNDRRFNRDIDVKTGYQTKNLIAMPVKLHTETVGVLQILNKTEGYFTENDEEHLSTFANYCGIALYIAKMYRRIRHSEQKYRVALDVLSYHSGFDTDELKRLSATKIPIEWPELSDFFYCSWDNSEGNQLLAFLYMFQTLFGIFSTEETENNIEPRFAANNWRFEKKTLMKFILTVKKNYRKVPYHNWSHAFTVGQSMFCMLMKTSHSFTVLESLALFVSCFCHDLDHRGKTNEYIVKSDIALGSLYTTSTMEHHHFNMTVSILQREEHNIFEHMNSSEYKMVLNLIRHDILATDLTRFFANNAKITAIVNKSDVDWRNIDHRNLFMEIFMTSCDLSAMYRPWDLQLSFVNVIMQEFWDQGDLEKKAGLVPARMMDRDYNYELPDLEFGFIQFICLPCYSTLNKIVSGVAHVLEGLEKNLAQWKGLKDLPKEEKIKMFSQIISN